MRREQEGAVREKVDELRAALEVGALVAVELVGDLVTERACNRLVRSGEALLALSRRDGAPGVYLLRPADLPRVTREPAAFEALLSDPLGGDLAGWAA